MVAGRTGYAIAMTGKANARPTARVARWEPHIGKGKERTRSNRYRNRFGRPRSLELTTFRVVASRSRGAHSGDDLWADTTKEGLAHQESLSKDCSHPVVVRAHLAILHTLRLRCIVLYDITKYDWHHAARRVWLAAPSRQLSACSIRSDIVYPFGSLNANITAHVTKLRLLQEAFPRARTEAFCHWAQKDWYRPMIILESDNARTAVQTCQQKPPLARPMRA